MKLILLNGPAGVGKSTISKYLHGDVQGSVVVDVDELRRSIPDYKERRSESLLMAYEMTKDAIRSNLNKGETVIIDKAIASSDTLDSFVKIGNECGADVREIILFAPRDTVQARADERGYIPGSLLTRERVGELWDQMDNVRKERQQAIVINTESLSVEETYEKVTEAIS